MKGTCSPTTMWSQDNWTPIRRYSSLNYQLWKKPALKITWYKKNNIVFLLCHALALELTGASKEPSDLLHSTQGEPCSHSRYPAQPFITWCVHWKHFKNLLLILLLLQEGSQEVISGLSHGVRVFGTSKSGWRRVWRSLQRKPLLMERCHSSLECPALCKMYLPCLSVGWDEELREPEALKKF